MTVKRNGGIVGAGGVASRSHTMTRWAGRRTSTQTGGWRAGPRTPYLTATGTRWVASGAASSRTSGHIFGWQVRLQQIRRSPPQHLVLLRQQRDPLSSLAQLGRLTGHRRGRSAFIGSGAAQPPCHSSVQLSRIRLLVGCDQRSEL